MVLDVARQHGFRIWKFEVGVVGSMCSTRRVEVKCDSKID